MSDLFAEFKQAAIVRTFRRGTVFYGLPDSLLAELASITERKTVAKGEFIFREGTPVEGFFVVDCGAVRLHRTLAPGKERVLHVVRASGTFAEESLIPELGYASDATAMEDSSVLMIRKAEFISLLRKHPELALRLLRAMNEHLRSLMGLLDDLTFKDVKTRVANWLIQNCPDPESHEPYSFELPMAKRILASELGAMSETFSRTLGKLRKQRLIAVNGRRVTLLCPFKLTQFIRQQLGTISVN